MSSPRPRYPGTGTPVETKTRLLFYQVLVWLWLMNGNRQWCRWFQILWLSKPLQTLVPEPFGPLDVLSERKPLSLPCHRNQLAFGVIGNAAVSTTAAGGEAEMGVGVGGGVVLQPCFLSLRKHRSLCEGKTSLTPRNRDLVLEGWFLQSGPTAPALTDALITRPFWKKRGEGGAGHQASQLGTRW